MSHCTFCFKHKAVIEEIKSDTDGLSTQAEQIASGAVCSYAYHHEYQVEAKPKQAAKLSKDVCSKCSTHKCNPIYATNGCEHSHSTETT
jgi:hypothetical protein